MPTTGSRLGVRRVYFWPASDSTAASNPHILYDDTRMASSIDDYECELESAVHETAEPPPESKELDEFLASFNR